MIGGGVFKADYALKNTAFCDFGSSNRKTIALRELNSMGTFLAVWV